MSTDDEHVIKATLVKWCNYKKNEANYVQVAVSTWRFFLYGSELLNWYTTSLSRLTNGYQGAVIFASVVSSLSWFNIDSAHWSGPACWYASILLALASVLLGAQQTLVLPEVDAVQLWDRSQLDNAKKSLAGVDQSDRHVSGAALFAWQSHIMLLAYSIVSYVAGLFSVVLSPLAQRPVWGNDAKVCCESPAQLVLMLADRRLVSGCCYNQRVVLRLHLDGGSQAQSLNLGYSCRNEFTRIRACAGSVVFKGNRIVEVFHAPFAS